MAEKDFTPIAEGAWTNILDLRDEAQKALNEAEKTLKVFEEKQESYRRAEERFTSYIKGVAAALDVDLDTHRVEDRRFVKLSPEEIEQAKAAGGAVKEADAPEAQEGEEEVDNAEVVDAEFVDVDDVAEAAD